jgi:hypothetical protein
MILNTFAPYAIPLSSWSDIQITGSHFLEMSPESTTGQCRFTKKTTIIENDIEYFITPATIESDTVVECDAPHGEGANGEFIVEVTVDLIPPRPYMEPRYFKAEQTFITYGTISKVIF